MRHRSHSEAGFSLLELMIAMLITLIVSGAIYGLLAAGQTAFRREPEVAELTQSLRTAMSMIQQDVELAGNGFSTFTQVFTDGLDDQSGATEAQLSVVAGNDGKFADQLELIAADEQCPGIRVCQAIPGGSGYIADVSIDVPSCMRVPGRLMAMVGEVGTGAPAFIIGQPVAVGAVGPACVAAAPPAGAPQGVVIDLPNSNGPTEWHPAAAPVPPVPVTKIGPVRVIRYRVALSGDPLDPAVPCLWRSETGGRVGPSYAAMTDPPGAAWQMVARGVEDLQVEYMNGGGAYADTPGTIVTPAPVVPPLTQIIRRVRVTMSARSTAIGLTGAMPPAVNVATVPVAVRVQITSEMSPRAALLWLQQIGDWK